MFIKTADELPLYMQCNGSHFMPPTMIDAPDTDPKARDEGIAAHWLATAAFNGVHSVGEMVDRKAPNGFHITMEMADHVTDYLDQLSPYGRVELPTSFGVTDRWQVNSRADYIFQDDARATTVIRDLKYGWRIVEPDNHWSLIAHAIGISLARGWWAAFYDLGIFQPRPLHRDGKLRVWRITGEQLYALYQQLDAAMSNPSQQLQTGPLCHKCPAVASCPAATAASYNAIEASERASSEKIGNDQLAYELDLMARAELAIKTRREALEELGKYRVRRGEVVKNYAIETQLTNRQFKDFVTPSLFVALTGVDNSQQRMGTPANAERLGVPKDIVNMFCERRETGLKLVRVDANKKAQRILGTKE